MYPVKPGEEPIRPRPAPHRHPKRHGGGSGGGDGGGGDGGGSGGGGSGGGGSIESCPRPSPQSIKVSAGNEEIISSFV